jgi:hypothetical protein
MELGLGPEFELLFSNLHELSQVNQKHSTTEEKVLYPTTLIDIRTKEPLQGRARNTDVQVVCAV